MIRQTVAEKYNLSEGGMKKIVTFFFKGKSQRMVKYRENISSTFFIETISSFDRLTRRLCLPSSHPYIFNDTDRRHNPVSGHGNLNQ